MKIDRHNYEEYFILYVDNELNAEERLGVEEFASIHPDLKDELDLLMQAKFTPEDHIVFENKEELMMINGAAAVNFSNYEEWLVLYLDNELDASQCEAVEQFMNEHAGVKEEYFTLLQTRVQPDTSVVFPDKNLLYRHEERRRIGWWKIAAAAVLLIAAGTTTVLLLNKKEEKTSGQPGYVSVKPEQKQQDKNPSNDNPVTPANDKQTDPQSVTPVTADVNVKDIKEEKRTITPKEQDKAPVIVQQSPAAIKEKTNDKKLQQQQPEEKPLLANNNTNKPSNNLPQPKDNPYVIAQENKPNTEIANAIADNPLTKTQGTNVTPPVTKPIIKTSPIQEPATAEFASHDDSGERSGKKNKLRGFLRKVTRTFEKTTNIDATDQDDRLLVGGLAIRLK